MARPTERKAVAALLDQPADDADELAARIIDTLDALRAGRAFYVAAVQAGGVSWAYGPFSTPRQAGKLLPDLAVGDAVTGVVRVFPPLSGEDPAPSGVCSGCRHPAASHNWPRSRNRGCVVGEVIQRGRVVRPACDCEGLT